MESRISAIAAGSIGRSEIAPTIPHMAAGLLSILMISLSISWCTRPPDIRSGSQSHGLLLIPFALDVPSVIKRLGEKIHSWQPHQALQSPIQHQEPRPLDRRTSQNVVGPHQPQNLRCLVQLAENIEIDRPHKVIFRSVRFMTRES